MKIEISDNKKWHQSLTIKMILLGFLGLFLLIPLELIKEIIKERQNNYETVKKEIAAQWAGDQYITGPVLNIPVIVTPSGKGLEPYRKVFHIMPESCNIDADIQTEIRYRSIYKAVVYNSAIKFSGEFVIPSIPIEEEIQVLWNESYFSIGISDNRGLKGDVKLQSDDTILSAIPGTKDKDLFASGISFDVNIPVTRENLVFNTEIHLSGSGSIMFSPVGKTTQVKMNSTWDSPGFQGNFLPSERVIEESGFSANWIVTDLNRSFPQTWFGGQYSPASDSLGVSFIMPVDHYQKSLRSAKYGLLFIALTFMALLFLEFTIKERIHLFHYVLVSLSLVLFFSLLNALGEHIGFNLAYLISSLATIGSISLFLNNLIKKTSRVLIISGLLVILYAFIFVLMTLDEYAYLAGNIALFIFLAITMRLSVKLKLFNDDSF